MNLHQVPLTLEDPNVPTPRSHVGGMVALLVVAGKTKPPERSPIPVVHRVVLLVLLESRLRNPRPQNLRLE